MAMEGLEKLKKKERELCMDELEKCICNDYYEYYSCEKPKDHLVPQHATYTDIDGRKVVVKWIWELEE